MYILNILHVVAWLVAVVFLCYSNCNRETQQMNMSYFHRTILPHNASMCILGALTYTGINFKKTTAELKQSHKSVNGGVLLTGKTIVLFPCKPRYHRRLLFLL